MKTFEIWQCLSLNSDFCLPYLEVGCVIDVFSHRLPVSQARAVILLPFISQTLKCLMHWRVMAGQLHRMTV